MKGFGWSNNGSGSPLADGFLQIEGGATISASLQRVVDKAGNNSSLFLANNLVGVSSAIQYDWIPTPTGAANKTTMWFDGTGRMNWRPGTGASSFIRTFDATSITADRVYTLPNNTMTFIGTGAAIDSTLRAIVGGGTSPLQLSTSQIGMAFSGVTNPITWRANGTLTDYSGWHQADGTYRLLTKDGAALFINNANGINIQNGLGSTGRTSIDANGNWNIGGSFTNAARLHVRGDGTNPVFRAENSLGTALFTVDNTGVGTFNNTVSTPDVNLSGGQRALSSSTGYILLTTNYTGTFTGLRFGGTTAANPMIKRVSDSIEIRYADDSGYANFTAAIISSTGGRLNMSAAGTFGIRSGTGSPEGVITATVGSMFMRTDGGAGTSFYVKESGTGNTGWVAK